MNSVLQPDWRTKPDPPVLKFVRIVHVDDAGNTVTTLGADPADPSVLDLGRRAAEAAAAWRQLPQTVIDRAGKTRPNPDRMKAGGIAGRLVQDLAGLLGVPVASLGTCARRECGAYCRKYGPGGGPLCPPCHAEAVARDARARATWGGPS